MPDNNKDQLPQTTRFGRYQILAEVGRGATAFVYKAYDPELDRYLAIKLLKPELAKDLEFKKAFLHEARLAAQLNHGGIVTIFDVGEAENKPYIAMELLDGVTLEQILNNQGALGVRTTLAMVGQLASALNYAHKNGVCHRDIKPANIVILKDKKTVKLTDFGIAQLEDSRALSQRSSDKVMGTPEYMAPEQVLGQAMDARTDLYSLGILIFRMLMGKTPFASDQVGELFKKIVKQKPPLLELNEPDLSHKIEDDLRDLVRKLIQKKPEKRFQSTLVVVTEIKDIQEQLNRKLEAKKPRFVSLPLRWTAIMASTVFVAMCISLVLVYLVQNKALSGITFEYGRSIARMIAFQSAEPILLGDRLGLGVMVSEYKKNEQLDLLYIVDVNNVIIASALEADLGSKFIPPLDRDLVYFDDGVKIFERQQDNSRDFFDLSMSINYAGKSIGHLYLSYSAGSMYAASKTTLIAMLILMLLTLLVIFLVTFILARKASQDYKRMSQALTKLAAGRYDARLPVTSNDEKGQLFSAFNFLAEHLDRSVEHGAPKNPNQDGRN